MSRIATRRLLASSNLCSAAEAQSMHQPLLHRLRSQPFSNSTLRSAEPLIPGTASRQSPTSSPAAPTLASGRQTTQTSGSSNDYMKGLMDLGNIFDSSATNRIARRNQFDMDSSGLSSFGSISKRQEVDRNEEPHHFHIFATKHNTHITLTSPSRDPLISVSAGNIGFKHSGRKHYDSAFQLAGFAIKKIQEKGLIPQIKKMEVTLRGFGAGREAVTKVLLGTEGRLLRTKIVKVSDATRLKFGGTRSPKPRRLG